MLHVYDGVVYAESGLSPPVIFVSKSKASEQAELEKKEPDIAEEWMPLVRGAVNWSLRLGFGYFLLIAIHRHAIWTGLAYQWLSWRLRWRKATEVPPLCGMGGSAPALLRALRSARVLGVDGEDGFRPHYGSRHEAAEDLLEEALRERRRAERLFHEARREREKIEEAERRRAATPEQPKRMDPYELLGIEREAGAQDVKRAYHARIAEYHPDKVAHLGRDLRELAAARSRELIEAYERVRPRP